jgi:ribonuclease R
MGQKNINKKKKRAGDQLYRGTLEVTRSGMGFVVSESFGRDVLVRPNDFNTALHGDTVLVRIGKESAGRGRVQGAVEAVVERKRTEFPGHIEMGDGFAFFIAETERPVPDIYIPGAKLNGAVDKSRVIVRITGWSKNRKPQGEVIQVLNEADENDRVMKEILLENGFPVLFPEEVLKAAERLPDSIPAGEIAQRRDFRNILTFTIDPADAKDFDDAISFRVIENDWYEIGVHIADVSHYVKAGSLLDEEAYHRGTSVYLPDRVNPMLPERISNELCSLRPNEDKLTFSAVFKITPKGEVKDYWLGRTLIHSDHRFTYEDVQEIIDSKQGKHYEAEILILHELAQRFRRQRIRRGAINFSSVEVRFRLDEKGKPIGVTVKESRESHQLIEEFMLLANRTVAGHVSKIKIRKKPVPFPYRIHDTPDKEKLAPFVLFAKKYGHHFDTKTPEGIAASFNQMLQDVHGKPEQHVLEQLGIRTMAKAAYSVENIGHFGLGFSDYCHFTSPIRRYPDVLTHRILQEVLEKNIQVHEKLDEQCVYCSERERAAMESERAANKYKQVEFMKEFIGEEFEGVISGVAGFGFWVETLEQKCEGLVSLNSLIEYDDFRLVESEYALVGRRSGRSFRMGDRIRIKVIAANLARRQLDYEWVLSSPVSPNSNRRRK